jgi:TetR/AcrR family transcriptional regulator
MAEKLDTPMEQAILREAERLFLEKGFALTSTTEIAKAVGCNQALIHYYFRTKEHLFAAVFESKMRVVFEGLSSIDATNVSFEEALRRMIEVHFDVFRANPRLPFLIVNELITNPSRIAAIKERMEEIPQTIFSRLDGWLKVEIDGGRIRPIGAFDLVADVVSLNAMFFLAAPILKTALGLSEAEMERMTDVRRRESVELILRGLRP